MGIPWRRFLIPVAVPLAALLPATALAADFGLTVGSPSLTARTLINVPVTVTCSIDPSVATFIFDESVDVNVQQAAGRSFATGAGSVSGSQTNSLAFPCNGTPTRLNVAVLANPGGVPFHGGPAVISASMTVIAGYESFPGCGCGPINVWQTFSANPQTVTLH
jgi:hypothetical protein